ncbi:MAG: hypothetical protein J1E06_03190 [Acutalibacter sp.]|nr:hypothetical protein [Acutalibacter sp.]
MEELTTLQTRQSKWAQQLLLAQNEDGGWGCFHTLSVGAPTTTEQALRRLEILGFTEADPCIQKALEYMDGYLGTGTFPNGNEKWKGWDIFCDRALATWICRFTQKNERANAIADQWANVVAQAFRGGDFDADAYAAAFNDAFGMKPRHGFENISNFYPVSLLRGRLDDKTDAAVIDYLINASGGIYYVCEGPLKELPKEFQSRRANRYLSALELMSGYTSAPTKLKFAAQWLENQRSPDGTFDLGTVARDMVNLPLSDNRGREGRVTDCTYRVERLLRAITI